MKISTFVVVVFVLSSMTATHNRIEVVQEKIEEGQKKEEVGVEKGEEKTE